MGSAHDQIAKIDLADQVLFESARLDRGPPFYSSLGQSDVTIDESLELRNSARPGFTGSGHRKQRKSVLTKLKIMVMISANPVRDRIIDDGRGY